MAMMTPPAQGDAKSIQAQQEIDDTRVPVQVPGEEAQYDDSIQSGIEEHLNSLPPEQQDFLAQYLTPELAALFGIVLGKESYDYFAQYANPNKSLQVVDVAPQGGEATQGTSPAAAPVINPQSKGYPDAQTPQGMMQAPAM